MMTDDFWFRGFPAAWNLIAPVMFLMQARTTRRRGDHDHPVGRCR